MDVEYLICPPCAAVAGNDEIAELLAVNQQYRVIVGVVPNNKQFWGLLGLATEMAGWQPIQSGAMAVAEMIVTARDRSAADETYGLVATLLAATSKFVEQRDITELGVRVTTGQHNSTQFVLRKMLDGERDVIN